MAGASPHVPPLLYTDRYRNEGTRTYSAHAAYSEAAQDYRPGADIPDFEVAVFELPREQVNVYSANPPDGLGRTYCTEDTAMMVVHPQVLAECPDDPYVKATLRGHRREGVRVAPSSSTRTVYVLDDTTPHPHALKVHFPFRVSRYGRRMRDEVVAQAVAVSRELEAWSRRTASGPAFLREVLGVTHVTHGGDAGRGENWGYLVRDLVPFPAPPSERHLVPGFALYGRDFFDPARSRLIFELADRKDPLGWALDRVLLPVIRDWVGCFLQLGFALEPHGQNVLLEVDDEGAVSRIVHRDLSCPIDMRRRRDLGLPNGRLNGYNRMEDGVFNSIAFDKFMGSHFFDRVAAALLEVVPRAKIEDLRGPCRQEFASRFPEHERYMPLTVHYFRETRDRHGKPLYRDTGERPTWRP